MEVSALKPTPLAGLRGPSPLLKLQSDERLIALIRRGQHAAFETLFSRYQARLLAFCRHMLSSKEDAEDVLQEVFTAAFNAILADEREINVRPWLYRIARNRSLNHLRRASAIGVDSMDVHYAENGISTGEKVMRRESFRQLIEDVQQLPETQRTALLLREIDALSYEQIAEAMETTIPSVKSLLVRARISLAEASEARELSCADVRAQLGEVAEGICKLSAPARRHMRGCERCRSFRKHLKANNVALAAVMPVGPLLLFKKLLYSKLGAGAHVAGGAGAGAGAGAAATGGAGAASSIATAGAGAIASKAVAGIAAAALVTAGAVEAERASTPHPPPRHTVAAAPAPAPATAPVIVSSSPQRDSIAAAQAPASHHRHHTAKHAIAAHRHRAAKRLRAAEAEAQASSVEESTTTTSSTTTSTTEASATAAVDPAEASTTKPASSQPPVTEVMTETTSLPSTAGTTESSTTESSTATSSSTTTSTTATESSTTESSTTSSSSSTTTSTATSVTGGTPAPGASAPSP